MKILFGLIALNEIDYIEAVIESVRPYCDRIIVVESCARKPYKFLYELGAITQDGLSVDGTTEFLASCPGVIHHKLGVLPGSVESGALNKFAEHADAGDYIWVGTGNEVYFDKSAQKLSNMMRTTKENWIDCSMFVLWHDLKHHIVGGGWGEPSLRGFRYCPALFPIPKNALYFPVNNYVNGSCVVPDALVKLAFARCEKRVFQKIALQEIEYNNRLHNLGNYSNLEDYIKRTNNWYTNVHANGISIETYDGMLPALVSSPDVEIYNDGWSLL